MITKDQLIEFEQEVASQYNASCIRAPVHLSAGNEDQLIEVFKRVKSHDYVFSTWRSHYHALLHGVPRDELMAKVLRGESITICVPERRFYSSAICGGNLPIALGVAWALRFAPDYRRGAEHVWCFVGDMAAEMGAFAECTRYAANHDLPIAYVVEDNGKCVNTPTAEVWGRSHAPTGAESLSDQLDRAGRLVHHKVVRYRYKLGWPHMGAGKFVTFGEKKLQPSGGM